MNIIRFAIKHKPTKKWVKLKNGVEITLIDDICYATLSDIGPLLLENIKNCSYEHNNFYGRENFLEFELEKINIKYTILS